MYISTHKRFETAQNYVGTIQSCQSARIEKTSARIPCGDAVSVLKIESLEALEFRFLGVKAFSVERSGSLECHTDVLLGSEKWETNRSREGMVACRRIPEWGFHPGLSHKRRWQKRAKEAQLLRQDLGP